MKFEWHSRVVEIVCKEIDLESVVPKLFDVEDASVLAHERLRDSVHLDLPDGTSVVASPDRATILDYTGMKSTRALTQTVRRASGIAVGMSEITRTVGVTAYDLASSFPTIFGNSAIAASFAEQVIGENVTRAGVLIGQHKPDGSHRNFTILSVDRHLERGPERGLHVAVREIESIASPEDLPRALRFTRLKSLVDACQGVARRVNDYEVASASHRD